MTCAWGEMDESAFPRHTSIGLCLVGRGEAGGFNAMATTNIWKMFIDKQVYENRRVDENVYGESSYCPSPVSSSKQFVFRRGEVAKNHAKTKSTTQ